MQQAFSTFGVGERVSAGKEGVNVLRMALLRAGRMVLLRALLAHHFYVHLDLRSARQNIASTGRMILVLLSMSFIQLILTYLRWAGGWH